MKAREIESIAVRDVVSFMLGSELKRGIVVGSTAEAVEVVCLGRDDSQKPDEIVPDVERDLVRVPVSNVREVCGRVSEKVIQECWLAAAKRATRGYFQAVHAPAQRRPFTTGSRIPYAGRVFDEREMLSLMEASLEFWLTSGRYSDEFEAKLATYIGIRGSLLVNSGSSANLIAFITLTSSKLKERRIEPGDEVITVAAGFPTTIAPILQYGAVPVFVDVSLPTYNIDVSKLEEARSNRTKAVMVAHTLGNPFDLGAVKTFCEKYRLWLIEDNCDSLGSEYKINGEWKLTGSIGDVGTSSFYPPHHMTMGEGGAVYSHNPLLLRIAASFRDWGRDCWCKSGVDNTCSKRFDWRLGELPDGYDHKYVYSHFGYNLKATDLQAAIGCAQLEKLPSFVAARRKNWLRLREGVADLENRFILPEPTSNSRPSWFGFLLSLREPSSEERSRIVQGLEAAGIQTRMLFAGNFLRHPAFDDIRGDSSRYRVIGELRNSDYIMNNTFWMGVYPGLSESMIDYMIEKLHAVAG